MRNRILSGAPEPQDYRNASFILSAAKLGQCPADVGVEVAALTFDTRSGPLIVVRAAGGYEMDFPGDPPR